MFGHQVLEVLREQVEQLCVVQGPCRVGQRLVQEDLDRLQRVRDIGLGLQRPKPVALTACRRGGSVIVASRQPPTAGEG
jgi:hypothetical protein